MDHASWWIAFQGIVPILLLLVLVVVVVWAVMRLSRQESLPTSAGAAPAAPPADAAVEQARMRYARGEIDRDQYLRIAHDLFGNEQGGPAAEPPTPSP